MMWQLVIPAITQVLDKIIPDPQAAADAKLKALELAQKGDLAALDTELRLALGQLEVNKAAATTDMFRGGWRPAVGWVCVVGLAYQFVLQPVLPWLVALFGAKVPPLPAIDNESLMVLLTGRLGLGGQRPTEPAKRKS